MSKKKLVSPPLSIFARIWKIPLVPARLVAGRVTVNGIHELPGHPVPPGSSRVEIDLLPEGDGTRLRLTHTVGAPGFGAKVDAGWRHYTGRLALAAEFADPGPDPWRAT